MFTHSRCSVWKNNTSWFIFNRINMFSIMLCWRDVSMLLIPYGIKMVLNTLVLALQIHRYWYCIIYHIKVYRAAVAIHKSKPDVIEHAVSDLIIVICMIIIITIASIHTTTNHMCIYIYIYIYINLPPSNKPPLIKKQPWGETYVLLSI